MKKLATALHHLVSEILEGKHRLSWWVIGLLVLSVGAVIGWHIQPLLDAPPEIRAIVPAPK